MLAENLLFGREVRAQFSGAYAERAHGSPEATWDIDHLAGREEECGACAAPDVLSGKDDAPINGVVLRASYRIAGHLSAKGRGPRV